LLLITDRAGTDVVRRDAAWRKIANQNDSRPRALRQQATACAIVLKPKNKSPAEPGCKQNLFSMQNYFASFAI
jgi:hypothetical protein